jgi:hypothetical protein
MQHFPRIDVNLISILPANDNLDAVLEKYNLSVCSSLNTLQINRKEKWD